MTIEPGAGTFKTPTVSVTIHWCDDYTDLYPSTREIRFNGTNVTANFTYAAHGWGSWGYGYCGTFGLADYATSTGTVTLASDQNVLTAYIMNVGGHENSATATYTFSPYAVAVIPKGSAVTAAQSSTQQYDFKVTNTGSVASEITLIASCKAPVSACAATKPSVNLAANASEFVTVRYVATAAGTGGQVRLKATVANVQDEGYINVTVTAATQPALSIVNGGATTARSGCLITSAGSSAVYECGDLRIIHALPAVTTMNVVRAPALLYSSAHAKPAAFVAADLAYAPGATTPTAVHAKVTIDGKATPTRTLAWNAACASKPCRVTVPVVASDLSLVAGAHDYTLEVKVVNGATTLGTYTASSTLAIVDRTSSPYGAGWWLNGVEQLVDVVGHPDQKLWIGGDGSTRVYRRGGTSATWLVTPTVDRPDTLQSVNIVIDNVTQPGWRRRLRNGGYVEFDNAGQHVHTVNQLGWTTKLRYQGTTKAVRTIALPIPGGAAGPTYTLNYSSLGDGTLLLHDIVATAGTTTRTTTLSPGTGRFIAAITDPDGKSVTFAPHATYGSLIERRTNKRSAQTTYSYDSFWKLARVTRANGYAGDPAYTPAVVTTNLCAAETRILVSCGTRAALGLQHRDSSYTLLDGPRAINDTTRFWVNGWGAPTRLRDALGATTTIQRTEPAFPMLATIVTSPTGRVTSTFYTNRGLVESTVDNAGEELAGTNAVTHVAWHASLDRPATVTRVFAFSPNEVTSYEYFTDVARYGLRKSQQDARGVASRITFDYFTTGVFQGLAQSTTLPARSTTEPATATDSYVYDLQGNLQRVTSPSGIQRRLGRDPIGRVVIDSVQIDRGSTASWQTDSTEYESMGRVKYTRSHGPAYQNYAALTLETTRVYDDEGNLTSLTRTASPAAADPLRSRWTYDLLNRQVTAETEEQPNQFLADTTVYDEAGNVNRQRTRRLDEIHFTYDELNRVKTRVVPGVTFLQETTGMAKPDRAVLLDAALPYPYYPSGGSTGYVIEQDTETFTYDPVSGLLTDANNGHARVHREYFPKSGLLQSETLKVRTWAGGTGDTPFSKHIYTTSYTYDAVGRRQSVKYPGVLSPTVGGVVKDIVRNTYDNTGALATVTDLVGNVFRYSYNFRNEPSLTQLPGGISDIRHYDAEGMPSVDTVRMSTGTLLRQVTYSYDARGKLLSSSNAVGNHAEMGSLYDGMGQLRFSTFETGGYNPYVATTRNTNRYTLDAVGNIMESNGNEATLYGEGNVTSGMPSITVNQFDNTTGRLTLATTDAVPGFVTEYDASGNATWSTRSVDDPSLDQRDRRSYFAADNRLRAVDSRTYGVARQNFTLTFEEYRYDPLGRRVLTRSRRNCQLELNADQSAENVECRMSLIRRSIWDGSQEIGEIQMPGGDGVDLENDTQLTAQKDPASEVDYTPFFGIVAYTYGAALDQPLSVTRKNYGDAPQGWPFRLFTKPIVISPLWNHRGQADLGAFGVGASAGSGDHCEVFSSTDSRCVIFLLPSGWSAYARRFFVPSSWHGTLLEEKQDKTGMMYRRNRYYDPISGRFTQEDPIGFAGGMNAYGFASGDPINFADPFGLKCVVIATGKECNPLGLRASLVKMYIGGNTATQADLEYFGRHPIEGVKAQLVRQRASKFAVGLAPEFQDQNILEANTVGGPVDAIRHAAGACMLKRELPESAETILENHETDDNTQNEKEQQMDRANNGVGVYLAGQEGDCGNLAVQAYRSGGLVTIQGGSQ